MTYEQTNSWSVNSRYCVGFNGEYLDFVSGTAHLGNGYRAYSPVLMRFNCPDSWSPFGEGDINPYTYCACDPVNRADPSGHFSLGNGISIMLEFAAGIALSILTEGAAMPAALSLITSLAGNATIGAGSVLATEAIDGEQINWGLVGKSTEIGVITALAGYGLGRAYLPVKGGLSRAAISLAGYAPDQVAQFDRIALRGLRQGEKLLGGSDTSASNIPKFNFRGKTYEPQPYTHKLYRGDTRGTDEIFSSGFSSRGNNASIHDYISYSDRNGLFISFTKSKIKAAQYAVGGVFSEPGSKGYLYKVSHLAHAIDFEKNNIGMAENAEVVSTGFVSPQYIKGAYEVFRNTDHSLSFGRYIKNTFFSDEDKPWFKFWV